MASERLVIGSVATSDNLRTRSIGVASFQGTDFQNYINLFRRMTDERGVDHVSLYAIVDGNVELLDPGNLYNLGARGKISEVFVVNGDSLSNRPTLP